MGLGSGPGRGDRGLVNEAGRVLTNDGVAPLLRVAGLIRWLDGCHAPKYCGRASAPMPKD